MRSCFFKLKYKTIEFRILTASVLLLGLLFYLLIVTIPLISNPSLLRSVIVAFLICIFLVIIIAFNARVFLGKQLRQLNQSVKEVVDQRFSRKYKITPIDDFNEIGELSREVVLMLEKLHQRTTEIIEKRDELEQARNNLEIQVQERTREIIDQNHELEAQRQAIFDKSEKLKEINRELKRLSMVATKTENAIMIMDADGNILWLNECFTRLYSYTLEEFARTRGCNILQTSFYPYIEDVLDRCIQTKMPVHYEALNHKGDGTKIWTQTTLTPVLNEQGEITNLLTIDSDITLLKDAQKKIEEQARDITNSIRYAFRIQKALLPPVEVIVDTLSDFFVYYAPCEIVSGDFYYWYRKNNKLVIAVADCTGHGVPGAFMSMLGVSFLNELVKSDELQSAANLLERLRRRVIQSLRQTGKMLETNDGMDISLCIIGLDNRELQFSGAFNSLVYVRNGQVNEIKGDKMPIGIYPSEERRFTDHTLLIEPADKFYMYSDGVTDQFGGPNNRKFSSRRMREYIGLIANKPMAEQQILIDQTMNNWMGSCVSQLDDMCMVGFSL